MDARLPAPEMALARAAKSTAAAEPETPARQAAAAAPAASRSAPATPTVAPPVPIERITTEVVRALDARIIAWRERMGRT
jgi:hypothetical protein